MRAMGVLFVVAAGCGTQGALDGGADTGGASDAIADGGLESNTTAASPCSAPPPCGGDLSGTWTLVSACIDPPTNLAAGCQVISIVASGATTGGFTADTSCNLMGMHVDTNAIVTTTFSPTCACNTGVETEYGWCSPDKANDCVCAIGSISFSGGRICGLGDASICGGCFDAGPYNFDYCVQGNTLTLNTYAGQFPNSGVLTFTR